MVVGAIDWTTVIAALIAGLPAIIAAIFAGLVHNQVKTPSGPSIGKQVEAGHLTAIANNMLLSAKNGPTKSINPTTIGEELAPEPQVPAEAQQQEQPAS